MKRIAGIVLLSLITLLPQIKPVKYVDPFLGTDAHGHTYPGATMPFGMVQLSPDTDIRGWDWCSGYHSSDSSIMGFSHTHLSGTGGADYGDILIMPTCGKLLLNPGDKSIPRSGYRSSFNHSSESAEPGYYRVTLSDYNIDAELTATYRSGFHRYTFHDPDSARIVLDLDHGISDVTTKSYIKVVNSRRIEGFRYSRGWAQKQKLFFIIEFSEPFSGSGIASGDSLFFSTSRLERNSGIKAWFNFDLKKDGQVLVKVALSPVDIQGASGNLKKELPGWNFEKTKAIASAEWNKELSKILVEGKSEDDKVKFYTALYHCFLTPNLFSDCDGRYPGMDGIIHKANGYNHYTVFSLWDTFRAEHPLLTIIDKKRTRDFILSMLDDFDQYKLLPVWELAANETNCMIGYHAVPVIADAIVKGIRSFDMQRAFKAMTMSAEQGKFGINFYKKFGFIPIDKATDAVSRTLEYAYDDWTIAQTAKILNKQNEYKYFLQRSQYYKNVIDPVSGFMRGRTSDGNWRPAFDPVEPFPLGVGDFTEGNSWQYSWFVPQDIFGLINGMGGKDKFVQKLDSLFIVQPSEKYHQPSDVTGLIGQYAHGNEPSHHTVYLYNYVNQPWKTQQRVRQIMEQFYLTGRSGLCGNEDCGQMSAWFVFSAMGFYPVTPASDQYAWGSPLFDKVIVQLESGMKFTITAENNSKSNIYPRKISVNGKTSNSPFLKHGQIENGSLMNFQMTDKPGELKFALEQWEHEKTREFSGISSSPKIVFAPWLDDKRQCFINEKTVSLKSIDTNSKIYYSLNDEEVTLKSKLYKVPFSIIDTCTLYARCFKDGLGFSEPLEVRFYKSFIKDSLLPFYKENGTEYPIITLKNPYHKNYPASGNDALIDGFRGSRSWGDKKWQAYYDCDLDATIDLGKPTRISKITVGLFTDAGAHILFPTSISFLASDDGLNFETFKIIEVPEITDYTITPKDFSAEPLHFTTRYLRIIGKNHDKLPKWHHASGGGCYIFADEILIQ